MASVRRSRVIKKNALIAPSGGLVDTLVRPCDGAIGEKPMPPDGLREQSFLC